MQVCVCVCVCVHTHARACMHECTCKTTYGVRVGDFLGLYSPSVGYKEMDMKESLSKTPEWARFADQKAAGWLSWAQEAQCD